MSASSQHSHAPLTTAQRVAKAFFGRRPAQTLPWRWDASVGVVGLAHLMDVSADARADHLEDLLGYQTSHLRAPEIALSDHCVGAQSSLRLLRWHDDTEARFAVTRVVGYLRTAPENDLGVLDHLGRSAWYRHFVRPGAWVDSMMMYVLTAAQLGDALTQPWLESLAVRHAEAFCNQLQGPTGLFRHAKLLPDRRAPVHWLRGNGWAATCLVELAPRSPCLARAFERQAGALLDAQAANGLWPTIMDAPCSPHETSGSALVAYALVRGARTGLLPPEAHCAAWRTWHGLCDALVPLGDGMTLGGISAPCIPGPPAIYRWTPRLSGLAYGVGAFLMLAAELGRDVTRGEHP